MIAGPDSQQTMTPNRLREHTGVFAGGHGRSWLGSFAIAVLAALLSGGPHAATIAAAEVIVRVSATTPHVADGIDESAVTVTVTDSFGRPIANADIELEISQPAFVNQLAHFVLRLLATHVGNGRYVASFVSPVEGPMMIVATDRTSLASDLTFVDFTAAATTSSPLLSSPGPREVLLAPQGAAQDAEENCKKFFDKLDDEFLPSILRRRIAAEPDATKKATLRQRLKDLTGGDDRPGPRDPDNIMSVLRRDIALETKIAKGETPTQAEKDELERAKQAAKASFERNSMAQEQALKEFFGNPIDFTKFQACTELFNNFKFVADLDKAIERIQKAMELTRKIRDRATRPADRARFEQELRNLGRVVERGPNGSIAHIRWARFANIAIDLDINKDLWRNMKPILAKGSAITIKVLSDNNPRRGGIQPGRQSDTTIGTVRSQFDPFKPKETDTEDEKRRKIEELEKKLIDLIKTVSVDRSTIAQLPGLDGTSTLLATIGRADCVDGNEQLLETRIASATTLNTQQDALFGFGVDNAGATYIAVGIVTGSQVSFAISGFGLSPGIGPAVSAYTGTIIDDTIVGNWEGVGSGLPGDPDNTCTFTGDFIIGVASDLSIHKTGQPKAVRVGDRLTYMVRVTNRGPADATGVVVTDILPSNVEFISASSGCSHSRGTVTCSIGNLGNSRRVTRQVTVLTTASGDIRNTATVAANGPDPNTNNNTDTAVSQAQEVPVKIEISTQKNVRHGSVETVPGGLFPTVFQVANEGLKVSKQINKMPHIASIRIDYNERKSEGLLSARQAILGFTKSDGLGKKLQLSSQEGYEVHLTINGTEAKDIEVEVQATLRGNATQVGGASARQNIPTLTGRLTLLDPATKASVLTPDGRNIFGGIYTITIKPESETRQGGDILRHTYKSVTPGKAHTIALFSIALDWLDDGSKRTEAFGDWVVQFRAKVK